MLDFSFYKDKKVLVTGHTGFKGSYMCEVLLKHGAHVTGYALAPPTEPSLFELCGLHERMHSIEGDIRDLSHLRDVFDRVRPELVIHMAAQPIVRVSYERPVETFETNIMGTVNVLECCRLTDSVRSVINVTTDKVYRNTADDKIQGTQPSGGSERAGQPDSREGTAGGIRGYVETDVLDGYDPYSNSKSCSELVTGSYIRSFLKDKGTAVSTCRAGNVIGGGDFARDRIIPDCLRAVEKEEEIIVRNPYSIRPYQHVLEPVCCYLMIAMRQYEDASYCGAYNVGPDASDCYTTGELTGLFCDKWNIALPEGFRASWKNVSDGGPHEAGFLMLDSSKLRSVFGWHPVWNVERAMEEIVRFDRAYINNEDVRRIVAGTIDSYLDGELLLTK